jgi:hypothetical protein
MAHGTPLGVGDNDKPYGTQGAFLIEAGISSSYHIANFFGLTEWIRRPKVAPAEAPKASAEVSKEAAKTVAAVPAHTADITSVLWPLKTLDYAARPPREPQRRAIDVGAVITRALTAAGLMK